VRAEPTLQAPWQVWALCSAVFAALTALFAKIGVDALPSSYATLVRTCVILVVVVVVWIVSGAPGGAPLATPRVHGALILSGAATGLSWLCYFQALKLGEATRVAPLDKLSVVFVAIFSVIFLGERLDLRGWGGVALIATGAVLLAARR